MQCLIYLFFFCRINSKLVKVLHRGMQCSSCGLRYPPEGTQQYSHHLDWHFRMNKKQQDSTKKVNTRKFYFTMDDWVQFEEIEDIEERGKNRYVRGYGSQKMVNPRASQQLSGFFLWYLVILGSYPGLGPYKFPQFTLLLYQIHIN